jgi:DNA modification methylase
VWEIPRPTASPDHPTVKPVELVARAIVLSCRPGDVVLDPFAGSGTTIIAAEQLGRRCCAVDIDPVYVDVAVRRWEEFTGRAAVRIR